MTTRLIKRVNEIVLDGIRTRYIVSTKELMLAEEQSFKLVDREDFGCVGPWRRVQSPTYGGELQDHPNDKAGKWLIFISNTKEEFLKHWSIIKVATLEGKLGVAAKIRKPVRRLEGLVICVYTKDYSDIDDVKRVREVLRDLGYDKTLPYKPDYETAAHNYGASTVLYRM